MTASSPPEPEPDLVGQRLDHYGVAEKLGEGGMGVVYRAVDEHLHREVALKVLPAAFSSDPERRGRFLREARAAAAVNHPCIATIHDVGEADGRAYIAMELLHGTTLGVASAAGAPWPARLGWLIDVATALHAAHRAGIVHRDVKPDNVMVCDDGRVKVLDFGIARRLDGASERAGATAAVTQDGLVVGTPRYMAPEQLRDEALDARTDQFAWGVMAYELLSGTFPWGRTEQGVGLVARILDSRPEPLDAITPELPKLVVAVVNRALEKDPAARFASMADVVAALRPWHGASPPMPSSGALPIGSDPTLAQPSVPPAPKVPAVTVRPPAQAQRPWVSTAVAGAAVAVAVALAWRGQVVGLGPAASAPAAPPAATGIADLPVPVSAVPEARAEYVAGIQATRDDNFGVAEQHFLRALALDPSMAIAHLRAAMSGASTGNAERKRAEFARAVALRAQLTPRDQALLEAMEPLLGRTREDRGEAHRRLEAAHARYPLDVELLDWLGMVTATDPEAGVGASSRATELDPSDAFAWEDLGRALAVGGDPAGARRAFDRCAAVAPDASDCFGWLGLLDAAEGRCAEFERDARRQADTNSTAELSVARALAATGAPLEAVRETVARFLGRLPEAERALPEAREAAAIDTFAGRFDLARQDLEREARALAADAALDAELVPHGDLARVQVGLALETGDEAGARRLAQDFAVRRATWTSREILLLSQSRSLWLERVAAGAAGLPDARRAAWIGERLAQGEPAAIVWTNGWAATSLTATEARAALDALAHDPRLRPLTPGQEIFLGTGILDAEAGRVERLAGDLERAIGHLRRAAANCNVLAEPFQHAHALLELGRALEARGDAPGACDAYGKLVAFWGAARPRSTSADAARASAGRLGCAK